MSDSKKEFEKLCRTLTGENKLSDISPDIINTSLMEDMCTKLTDIDEIYLIHDPSDIRKPHSKKTENIGKVRSLNGKIINGYSSYNVVAITPNDNSVHLLSHRSYSNKDNKFLKSEHIKKLEANKDFDGKANAQKLYESGDFFNKKLLFTEELCRVSKELKRSKSDLKITHIFDREFDDSEYFELINKELSDDFIIRLKKSNILSEQDSNGKNIKLISSNFESSYEFSAQKLTIKDKTYQDAKILTEYRKFNGYTAIRVTVKNRKGKNIFKDPMLLITNKEVETGEMAYMVYRSYIKRSKIEYVFRFLKDGLGWEEIQIRDFIGMQNLLSLCFYVSSYLYEIGEEIAYDDFAVMLAKIGGGKKKVTRHFILKGIEMLMGKIRIERIFKEHNVSKATQNRLAAIAGADLVMD